MWHQIELCVGQLIQKSEQHYFQYLTKQKWFDQVILDLELQVV